MELATTTHSVQEAGNVPAGTLFVSSQRVRRRHQSARTMFRRLLAAVVNGSEHPCWRSHDAFTHLALLPPREVNRLLDSGRVTRKGER
jgi:hypothetical protein